MKTRDGYIIPCRRGVTYYKVCVNYQHPYGMPTIQKIKSVDFYRLSNSNRYIVYLGKTKRNSMTISRQYHLDSYFIYRKKENAMVKYKSMLKQDYKEVINHSRLIQNRIKRLLK